jgi:hypothetical protein
VPREGAPRCTAFTAEVEVYRGDRVLYGRVVVESSGRVHLEHLDPATAGWCRQVLEQAVCGSGRAAHGWDVRAERAKAQQKVRRKWLRVGAVRMLEEVQLIAGAEVQRIRLLQHRMVRREP